MFSADVFRGYIKSSTASNELTWKNHPIKSFEVKCENGFSYFDTIDKIETGL